MVTRSPLILLVAAGCFASGTASAQVQNENRSAWAATGQVFDVTRVDNTLYVAGPANLGLTLNGDNDPLVLVDPTTAAPTRAVIEMSIPREGSVNTAIADGAGGWYVGGTFSRISSGGGGGWSGLAHLTPPDFEAGFKPTLNGPVNGLWKEGSTLYVVGGFTQVNGLARGGGAAFDLTTGNLLPWNPALDVSPGVRVASAIVLSGSTVFLGGSFTTASGTSRPGFAAVDATTGALAGTPTTTLNAGAVVNALRLSGSTLYLGGTFTAIGAANRANVGAIDITSGATTGSRPTPTGPCGRCFSTAPACTWVAASTSSADSRAPGSPASIRRRARSTAGRQTRT